MFSSALCLVQAVLLFCLSQHCGVLSGVHAEQDTVKHPYKILQFDSETETNPPRSASQKPHIILIVADDLGYNDVSFHGSNQIPTPNIDFLGYNGVILNNYYVSPICTPTRSALMTGRHPIHTGMQHDVIVGTQPFGLPLNETLLPQYLNKLGYRSHIVGKWHLGMFKWEHTPLYRGFESHLGYLQGCEDYYTHTYEARLDQWGLDFRRNKELLWNCTGQYSTTLFRDEAVRIIEQHNKSQPLFLYLPFQAVHTGNANGVHLQAPNSYIDKFTYIKNHQRRVYAAMVSALDDAVGDVYDTLKKQNMLANSIIVFTTDNGGPANGLGGSAANNFPLRGIKFTLWEGGVRGVGLVHSPLLHRQGYVSNKMLHVCDWLPTLVTAAGGAELLKNVTSLDGVNAWEMLSSDGKDVRSEMIHNIDPTEVKAALRMGDYKLLIGAISLQRGGWYPPYQMPGDNQNLHYLNFTDDVSLRKPLETRAQRQELYKKNYRSMWPSSVNQRLIELYSYAEKSDLYTGPYARLRKTVSNGLSTGADLKFEPEGKLELSDFKLFPLDSFVGGTPVTVHCGPKPANASTNCQPTIYPCLYHIPSDPCEYNNIAASNSELVRKMVARIADYSATMVPPGNKPFDDRGNPRHHQGAWEPWQ